LQDVKDVILMCGTPHLFSISDSKKGDFYIPDRDWIPLGTSQDAFRVLISMEKVYRTEII
jgi:hypothetical protein